MWLLYFSQIILPVANLVTGNLLQNGDCAYFEKDSGFLKLLQTPVKTANSVISLEIKAYNCDSFTLTVRNDENYSLAVKNWFSNYDGAEILDLNIFGSCNGYWHEVKLFMTQSKPVLSMGPRIIQASYDGYKLDEFLEAFRNHSLYLGIHAFNDRHHQRTFRCFIRNIQIDGRNQAIDTDNLSGTFAIRDCPKDLQFSNNFGSVLLSENFHVTDDLRLYFEIKTAEKDSKCSALLLSAHSHRSHVIIEIVDSFLYMRIRSGDAWHNLKVYRYFDDKVDFCDGSWHKIALLKNGNAIRMMADRLVDNLVDNTSHLFEKVVLNFIAPLYMGMHPEMKRISAIESRKPFNGCLRSLQINDIVTEITENTVNAELVK